MLIIIIIIIIIIITHTKDIPQYRKTTADILPPSSRPFRADSGESASRDVRCTCRSCPT